MQTLLMLNPIYTILRIPTSDLCISKYIRKSSDNIYLVIDDALITTHEIN